MVVFENSVKEIGNFFAPHVIKDVLRDDEMELIKPNFVHENDLFSSLSYIEVENNAKYLHHVSHSINNFTEQIVDSYDFRVTASFGYFTYNVDGTAVDYICCDIMNYHVLSDKDYADIYKDLAEIECNRQNNMYSPELPSDIYKIGRFMILLQILQC